MDKKFEKLDAGESVFFARELEHIKTKAYDVKTTSLKARQIIPTSFEAGPAAETITYEQYDQVGLAKVVRDYSTDFKAADVVGKEFTAKVKSLGSAYQYSVQEIRAAAAARKPLTQRKANSAKRAIDQLENKIAYFGEATYGLLGLFNNPNVPVVVLPNAGAFSTLTPAQALANLNALANNPINVSNGVETPDTLLLPIEDYTHIASTPRSDNSDTTILQYFLQNNPFISSVDWLEELKDGGGVGVKRAIAYRRDPDALTLEIPQDFEQFEVEQRGMAFKVPCHERIAGVLFYYPLSAAYADLA